MCGIVGYIGDRKIDEVLLEGLRRLEYRGYDSCGLALNGGNNGIYRKRALGRIDNLASNLSKEKLFSAQSGIAHTRWATHGEPSEDNSHPHCDCSCELVVVHNGIIENYSVLKEELEKKGHKFSSQTDTEVIAHLIEEKIKEISRGFAVKHALPEPLFFEAFRRAVNLLTGSFAVSALWIKAPGLVISARMHSPLVVGCADNENFLASDVSAFLKYTKKVYFVDDGEIVALKKNSVDFYDFKGKKKNKEISVINWDLSMAEKGGYRHFMLKEIHEQPLSAQNTLAGRLLPFEENRILEEIELDKKFLLEMKEIQIIACGTAFHAGLSAKYVFEKLGIKTSADLASEFENRAALLDKKTLVIAVSQSGETADTLHAVKAAKKNGNKVLAVTNTLGSSLTREADHTFYTHCGPEIGVASTKAFLGQLTAFYMLAVNFAYVKNLINFEKAQEFCKELLSLPDLIEKALSLENKIEKLTEAFSQKEHYLFIGRDVNYPIALEGALKIKEISYVHAEGYAAGEMKHGPIAIIENGMPVLALALSSQYLDLIKGNMEEAKARGAEIIAVVDEESKKTVKAKHYLEVPKINELFSGALASIPLQLFAYYIALQRKCDIDKPRNLAKSVTVR
ncbi:MAG: glutamine--fructose-6-phosphate transaminase (isomerizing) [Elusimicrobia bacterium]|nr:glutamine--fructose-6-phosphate transaminase (isomerizing) [Elusimicrobiota bacterium]